MRTIKLMRSHRAPRKKRTKRVMSPKMKHARRNAKAVTAQWRLAEEKSGGEVVNQRGRTKDKEADRGTRKEAGEKHGDAGVATTAVAYGRNSGNIGNSSIGVARARACMFYGSNTCTHCLGRRTRRTACTRWLGGCLSHAYLTFGFALARANARTTVVCFYMRILGAGVRRTAYALHARGLRLCRLLLGYASVLMSCIGILYYKCIL